MKILFHHRIASRDGQSVHLEELVKALRAQAHEVRVVGPASFERARFGAGIRWVTALRGLLPGALFELLELGDNWRA